MTSKNKKIFADVLKILKEGGIIEEGRYCGELKINVLNGVITRIVAPKVYK